MNIKQIETQITGEIADLVERMTEISPEHLSMPFVTGAGRKSYQSMALALLDSLDNKAIWAAFMKLVQTKQAAELREAFATQYASMWAAELADIEMAELEDDAKFNASLYREAA